MNLAETTQRHIDGFTDRDALKNPFTPTFGEVPACMAGRREILHYILRALDSTVRDPYLTTILSGARGTGKTALMSTIADQAAGMGWVIASATSVSGMLDDLEIRVRRSAAHLLGDASRAHIKSIGIPQVLDIELETETAAPLSNWRSRIEDILIELDEVGAGILFTIDEVNPSLDELVQFGTAYQHFIREHRKVACIMAGLPTNINALEESKTLSFLRRAQLVDMGRISDYEISSALRRTIEDAGRAIASDALDLATKSIDGYPFLMQLVGYRAWDANPKTQTIDAKDVAEGAKLGRHEMFTRIVKPTFRELTDADIAFMCAMSKDNADSKIADLVERLGWSASQVSQYKRRLEERGVIGERRRGVVGFEIPYTREYIREYLAV